MADWVNFAEIRSRVSLEDVITRYYQITTLTRDGRKLVGPCPVHNGDSPRAFHADLDKNVWHCFSKCKKGGNQLDFVAAKDGISVRDAALKLQAVFLSGSPPPSPSPTPVPASSAPLRKESEVGKVIAPSSSTTPPAKPAIDRTNPVISVALDLKPDHPHLVGDRALKVGTVQRFEVGYCSRGIMRGMIAIPIHDQAGNLVAYAGRRLKPQEIREHGKYKLPKGFHKDLVLYNLHRAKTGSAETGLILVEGFFTVLKLYEAGLTNVVACMGCELSEAQVELLSRSTKEVILLFDGNEAGWSGAETAREKLAPKIEAVRVVRLPANTEPEGLSPRALRWLVNGMSALDLERVSFTFRGSPMVSPK